MTFILNVGIINSLLERLYFVCIFAGVIIVNTSLTIILQKSAGCHRDNKIPQILKEEEKNHEKIKQENFHAYGACNAR